MRAMKSAVEAEYDLSRGVRGKYLDEFQKGTNIVVLDPDVAEVFADGKQVNDILRALIPFLVRE